MRLRSWLAGVAALAFAGSGLAHAGQILSPVAVPASTIPTAGGSLSQLIDQSGLSIHFVSGVTDYDTYIGEDPTHAVVSLTNGWASQANKLPGYLEFDLGTDYAILGFTLWTQNSILAVNSFTLTSAMDANFTTGVTNLGSFNAAEGLNAQSYVVSGQGEFVRMEINSAHAGTTINLGEVAFDTEVLPEPGSLAVFGVGVVGIGLLVRRRVRAETPHLA